jgi:hypothetical protein
MRNLFLFSLDLLSRYQVGGKAGAFWRQPESDDRLNALAGSVQYQEFLHKFLAKIFEHDPRFLFQQVSF